MSRLAGLLALAAALLISEPAAAEVHRGIVYGHGKVAAGQAPLRLDLYQPAAPAAVPRPVVVLVHGGGFAHRTRTDAGIVRVARGLAAQGIAAASIDYRLAGAAPRPSQRVAPLLRGLPRSPIRRAVVAAVDDTLTAIGFLRRNAGRFGLDPARVGLVGASAGAMTAAHVAYVLDDYGIARPPLRFVGELWGGILIGKPAQLAPGDAPLFAVHGTGDRAVAVSFSDALVRRANEVGVAAEYVRVPGGGHGFRASGFFTWQGADGLTPYTRLVRFARSALQSG